MSGSQAKQNTALRSVPEELNVSNLFRRTKSLPQSSNNQGGNNADFTSIVQAKGLWPA